MRQSHPLGQLGCQNTIEKALQQKGIQQIVNWSDKPKHQEDGLKRVKAKMFEVKIYWINNKLGLVLCVVIVIVKVHNMSVYIVCWQMEYINKNIETWKVLVVQDIENNVQSFWNSRYKTC